MMNLVALDASKKWLLSTIKGYVPFVLQVTFYLSGLSVLVGPLSWIRLHYYVDRGRGLALHQGA